MFRIRRVFDDKLAIDKEAIGQVLGIIREQFPGISERDIGKIPQQFKDPIKYKFITALFVADDARGRVKGFALMHFYPDLHFSFLDYISAAKGLTGGGIGGALYERVREEASRLGSAGLFMECLPDDPALCPDPETQKANRSRLRFYERFGARPIVGTAYETPVRPDDTCPPYLVLDGLGQDKPLHRLQARRIVEALLRRKYGHLCPDWYIERVVDSFRDDPVRLREPRYTKVEAATPARPSPASRGIVALVVNERHIIHHVHERGYVESPVRIDSILKELDASGLFSRVEPRHHAQRHITAVHDRDFVEYLRDVCERLSPQKPVYPYIFPIRNVGRPPKDLTVRAGYYCIDTFTPLDRNAFLAAKAAVDCALTAADQLFAGFRLAYALVRPPGHHAERRAFGGFCYFNSAAIAAHYLSGQGKIAVLDIDYHHGNGTQFIFYDRPDVLTVSIHGHPSFAYPYFSGFEDEKGEGAGKGFNLNLPLPEQVDGAGYRQALAKALHRIEIFKPSALVVSLGLDPARNDPTGTWSLMARDFEMNGRLIGGLGLPTLVVQEGGYRIRSLGVNARSFFSGLAAGFLAKQKKAL